MEIAPPLLPFKNILLPLFAIVTLTALSACSDSQLSSPSSVALEGIGTNQVGTTQYLFATSSGTINPAENAVIITFSDPFLPLTIISGSILSQQITTGSCSSLTGLTPAISGTNGNEVTTPIGATGCTDQSILSLSMNTALLNDENGNTGKGVLSWPFTIDVAPLVVTPVTGNSAIDGTGTTEAGAGVYNISNSTDNSIVVTFSKDLSEGTLTATLSGCNATLGQANTVTGSKGTTVVWVLENLTSVVVGDTCTLNVSGIEDSAGNPDDPSDTYQSMNFTFD